MRPRKQKPLGIHGLKVLCSHAPRSDSWSANGPNGRSDSRTDSRSGTQPNAREARDGFSQRKPAQPQAVKSDADHPARPAAPTKSQPDADNAADGIRLNKAIAATGLCSRRKADELILAGRVSVDGKPEPNPGRQVLPFESIAVDGRILSAPQSYTYLLLNKPVHEC